MRQRLWVHFSDKLLASLGWPEYKLHTHCQPVDKYVLLISCGLSMIIEVLLLLEKVESLCVQEECLYLREENILKVYEGRTLDFLFCRAF